MQYLPLFLDLRGRTCAVVGGGATAARKCALLLRAGARVRLLADEVDDALATLERQGRVSRVGGPLGAHSFEDCVLAVVAVDDEAAAATAAALASTHRIPVNVVDRPRLCSAIMPAIVDRTPVLVAISTGGAAPVLGRLLRARLEAVLPARLGALARIARDLRAEVVAGLAPGLRRRYWESVLQGPIAEMVFNGEDTPALAAMRRRLGEQTDAGGEIYLVSSPPGDDPELMTLRGLRLLQQCDVAFCQASLDRRVVDLIRRDAELRTVAVDADPAPIVEDMSALARSGCRVAWLGHRGEPGNGRGHPASDHLARRLREIGISCLQA